MRFSFALVRKMLFNKHLQAHNPSKVIKRNFFWFASIWTAECTPERLNIQIRFVGKTRMESNYQYWELHSSSFVRVFIITQHRDRYNKSSFFFTIIVLLWREDFLFFIPLTRAELVAAIGIITTLLWKSSENNFSFQHGKQSAFMVIGLQFRCQNNYLICNVYLRRTGVIWKRCQMSCNKNPIGFVNDWPRRRESCGCLSCLPFHTK